MISKEQQGVLRGMLLALFICLVSLGAAMFWLPPGTPPAGDAAGVMRAALRWDLLIAIALAGNIAYIAKYRFFHAADIDAGAGASTERVSRYQSMLQNTLEQAVLAVLVHLLWASLMPWQYQNAVAAAALLFGVGRILFWRGYGAGATARALGFALTFYPSVLMLISLAAQFLGIS